MKILLLVLSPFIATSALAQASPPADSNVHSPAAAHATAAVTPEEWLRRAGTEPDLEKAEALLRAARIQHPADGSLKVALGKFLAQTKHDLNEAEKLIRSAYSVEADNPDRLQAYGNFLWKMRGDAKSAEPLLRSVLAIRERQFWKTHPAVLASLLDLALALDTCGKFVEAQDVYRQILLRTSPEGFPHLREPRGICGVSAPIPDRRYSAGLEQEHRAVLVIRVRELGREHPATMQSRNGLASALEAQGKPEEAEREFRSLLATRERVLGLEHRDIYSTCYQLAMCLEKQAKYEDALKFIQRAEAGWRQMHGESAPACRVIVSYRQRIEAELKGN